MLHTYIRRDALEFSSLFERPIVRAPVY